MSTGSVIALVHPKWAPIPPTHLATSKGNALRLEVGDQVYLEALYDVDVNSKRHYPMPGGKHGGIMALFFFSIDCDDGTYPTSYICADDQCIEAGSLKGDFATLEECSASCGSTVV